MITDPKTVPAGRVARLVFAAGVAVVSTLLIAPQTTEFGAKVGLLAGLVVMCVARYPLERFFPAANSDQDRLWAFAARLASVGSPTVVPRRAFTRGAIGGSAAVFLVTGIVAAGTASRGIPQATRAEVFPVMTAQIDPSTVPTVTVDPDVVEMRSDLTGPGAQAVAVDLAENLETETQALRAADQELLPAVDYADRLIEMRGRIDEAIAAGETVVDTYLFDSIRISSVIRAEGQGGLSLGLDTRGTVEEITYDAEGNETGRVASPFTLTFMLSRPTGGRWLLVATRPLE
jgi:hypothetical protein